MALQRGCSLAEHLEINRKSVKNGGRRKENILILEFRGQNCNNHKKIAGKINLQKGGKAKFIQSFKQWQKVFGKKSEMLILNESLSTKPIRTVVCSEGMTMSRNAPVGLTAHRAFT